MLQWLNPVGELIGMAGDWLKGRRELKKARLESDLRLAEASTKAKIVRLEKSQDGALAWERLSIEKSGWRASYFTVILSIPFVVCFIPGWDVYVAAGFSAIKENIPEIYQWAFGIAVGSAFGVRQIADFMNWKKGAK
jgi:hypothetical protein